MNSMVIFENSARWSSRLAALPTNTGTTLAPRARAGVVSGAAVRWRRSRSVVGRTPALPICLANRTCARGKCVPGASVETTTNQGLLLISGFDTGEKITRPTKPAAYE